MLQFLIPAAQAASASDMRGVTDQATTAASETTSGVFDFIVTIWDKAPFFFAAVIVIVVSYIVAKYVRRGVEKALMRSSQNPGAPDLIGKTAQIGIISVGGFIALQMLDIDLTLLVSGLSVGIGFAMKDVISNYFSGILILVNEPFQIGDVIAVGDTMGVVKAIEGRNITLRNFDGQKVTISNTDVFTQPVKNFTHNPERRISLKIGVSYSSDLTQVVRVIENVLEEHPVVLRDPPSSIIFTEFGESSINLEARFWVSCKDNWFQARSELITQIKREFDINDIQIPFPIRTLKTDTGEPLDAQLAQVKNFDLKKFKPTPALNVHRDRVVTAGSTDDFDPQTQKHQRREVEDKDDAKKEGAVKPEAPKQEKPTPKADAKKDISQKPADKSDNIFDSRIERNPNPEPEKEKDVKGKGADTPLFV